MFKHKQINKIQHHFLEKLKRRKIIRCRLDADVIKCEENFIVNREVLVSKEKKH